MFLTNNFISAFFYSIINFMHQNVVSNYVIIILILTLIIKFVLLPLDFKQRESTLKMSKLQPKIADIKARYKDPQTQNIKMRELYKKENVKMMSGCLPTIISLLIIMAFFGALQQFANQEIAKLVLDASKVPGKVIDLPRFLWVRNIWQADSGTAPVMPDAASWTNIVRGLPQNLAAQVKNLDYQKVIAPTLEYYRGNFNGWYLFPLIVSVSMYFSMQYSMSLTAQAPGTPGQGPVMKLIFSAMIGFVCLTSNSLFAFYFFLTNIILIAQTFMFKKYYDYRESKNNDKKNNRPEVSS